MALSDKQPELVRLSKVAREFNLGLHTVVEFLWQRGHEVDGNPNTKIPYALYQLVKAEFHQEKEFRERSREAFAEHQARHADHAIGQITPDMNGYWITQNGTAPPNATMRVHDKAVEVKNDQRTKNGQVILIDIFLAFQDPEYQHYQNLGGIALLKFLRIKGVKNHIVLLSPWSLVELLRMDPGYHVLASQGNTISKFTYAIDELESHEGHPLSIDQLAVDLAPEVSELRDYVKPAIRLAKDERHDWANWWGIDRLWYVHELVEGRMPGADRLAARTYPGALHGRIRQLRNQEVLFCHGLSGSLVHVALVALQAEGAHAEQQQIELAEAIKALEEEIASVKNSLTGQLDPLSQEILRSSVKRIQGLQPGASPLLAKTLSSALKTSGAALGHAERSRVLQHRYDELKEQMRSALTELEGSETDAEKRKRQLESHLATMEEMRGVLQSMVREVVGPFGGIAIHTMRYRLRERQPRLLMIDDQAHDGWAEVIQAMVYGGPSDKFKAIAPKEGRADEAYYADTIQPMLKAHAPEVVLLDLRLNREAGGGQEVDQLSGAQILRLLKRDNPGLPVVMTTASNKAWSVERLMRLGCDGFWTKEGVDLDMDASASVRNYARLLDLIDQTTGMAFAQVHDFSERIQKLKRTSVQLWWEPTNRGTIRGASRETVFRILDEALYLLRDHLASVELGRVELRPANVWFYPSLVVMHLSKVIEFVHNCYESEKIGQTDHLGKQLMLRRNSAAHGVTSPKFDAVEIWDHDRLFGWIKDFMRWLNETPTALPGIKVVGKITL